MPNLVGEGWTAPGKGLQQLGQGISSLGAGLQSMARDNDEEELHRFRVDATNTFNAVDMDDLEREGTYGDGTGEGYSTERVGNFDTRTQSLQPYLQSSNPRVRRAAEIAIAQRRGVVQERAYRYERGKQQAYQFGQTSTMIGTTFGTLNARAQAGQLEDPEQFDTELVANAKAMNDMIDKYPSISDAQRNALRGEAVKQMLASANAYYGSGKRAAEPGASDRLMKLIEKMQPFMVPEPAAVGPQSAVDPAEFEQRVSPEQFFAGQNVDVAKLPLGMRLSNNPTNIKFTGSSWQRQNFVGVVGPSEAKDQGDPQILFANPAAGYASAAKLALLKQDQGMGTVRQLIAGKQGWTPGFDAAAENVARLMGVKADDAVNLRDAGTMQKFLRALTEQEHGQSGKLYSDDLIRKGVSYALGGGGGPRVQPGQLAGPAQSLPVPPDLVGKDARTVSAAVAGKTPGVIHAVTDQTARTFGPQGYGDKTTGFITVNGRTYQFVNGGSGRGSIPLGEYAITRFTSGSQRANEGRSFRQDAFELSDAKDDAPGTRGQANRQGLLIHDGNNGVTKGCVGIIGDFEQFKRDLMAEQQKNGGRLALNLAPRPTKTDVAATPGPVAGTRVASRTDVASDAAPAAPQTSPGQGGGGPSIPSPADGAAAAAGRVPETQVAQAGGQTPPAPTAPRYRPSVFTEAVESVNKMLPAFAERDRAIMDSKVKSIEDRAGKGELPPVEEVQKTMEQLQRFGTPEQRQRFMYALEGGRVTQQYLQAPPSIVAEQLSALNALGQQRGFTPEMSAHKAALEKLQTKQLEGLNKSPLEWADGVGRVKLSQITPEMMAQDADGGVEAMRVRAAQAKQIGTFYERETVFLTPKEKDAFAAQFQKGGAAMVELITKITEGFGADAPRVFAEFSKDAPEAAMTGWLMANKGSTLAIADMAKALEMRQDPKFKSVAPSYEEARRVLQSSSVARGLFTAPKVEERAIQAANLLYEVRARRNGEDGKIVNEELWREGLMEVLGETEGPDGAKYGGVVRNGSWGMGLPIVIPPNMRQDKFWSVIEALRPEDLMRPGTAAPAAAPTQLPALDTTSGTMPDMMPPPPGPEAAAVDPVAARIRDQVSKGQPAIQAVGGAPVDDRGRPVPMSMIRNATLVSIGDGRYWLALSDPTNRNAKFVGSLTAPDGRFVLDLRQMEGVLKARVPDAYRN